MSGAALLLTTGSGPRECGLGLRRLLDVITGQAEGDGIACDLAVRGDPAAPHSALLVLSGEGTGSIVARWEGTVLWRSGVRGKGARKNWFLGVFRLPPAPAAVSVDPAQVRFSTFRAGGPGGQHQNTTDSAVRAVWTGGDGTEYVVVAREERSQHRNKALALRRLSELVAADAAEVSRAREGAVHRLHRRVDRGNPRHTFLGEDFIPG